MIWQSPLLMGLIDAAIVLAALAVMVVFYRHRRAIQTLRLNVAVTWIVLGLSVMALNYAGDLAIMFVLPALTSPEVAMAAMTDLHLNWIWLASLIAAACIAFGLFGLLSRLFPGISDSMTEIQAELEARRAAEASLRISEARFRDITEASSDWFWEMDENLRFSYISEGYGNIVGSLRETLLGTTRQETDVPGVDPEAWEAHLADLAAHRSFRDFHITRTRPDGSPVYLSINGKAIFDEAGNFLGYRGAGSDITERRIAEKRLVESEGRLQSFIKNSPGAVSIKSVEGRYLLANPVFANIFGMTSDAILGKRAEDLVGPSFAASSEAHDRAVIDSGEVVEREESLDLGQRVLELISVKFPLRDDRGAITAVGAIQIDITERKRAEKALRHAHDELEERVEARTAELRESEQSLANAQRIGHMGSWHRNIVTGDLFWSDETCRIFGLEPQDFGSTYDDFMDAVHPDDKTLVADAAKEAIASHEPYIIEFRLLRPNGDVRFAYTQGEVTYGDDGTPLRMNGIVQDMTERKQAEQVLRESEQSLANAQRIAHVGNWEWNIVTGDLHWSDEIYRIFGLGPREFGATYEAFLEAVHPDDRTLVTTAVNQAIASHEPYSIEHRLLRPDGAVRFVHERGEVIYDDDDQPVHMSGTVQDITERRAADEALRESRVWLSKAQSRAKLGFWDCSFDGAGVEHWSDNSSEILGFPTDDIFGGYENYLEMVHPDDRDFVRQAYRLHYPDNDDDSSGYDLDYRILRPDGSVVWINEIADQERDDCGNVVRTVGTIQDITERKLIEEEVRRLNEHLEALVEERTLELRDAQADLVRKERLAALGQLTASVSHELRNPLGALRTAVAVMKRINADDPLLVESAGIADRSIDRCDAIITDLLDFTRLHPLRLTPIWLDQWLDGLLDEYRLPEGIELRREFASGVEVHFDPERVRRILLNLLDNATQAMTGDERASRAAAGGHVLTVASRMGNRRFEVVIGDTGPGIPPNISGDIFEPLFSTKNFGVGLGLPIVLQIAKQHGGGVEVSRAPAGGGAEFTLWLPTEAPELREAS